MSIVKILREKGDKHFNIEKYPLEDLSSSHTILFLIDHMEIISDYFTEHRLESLSNEDKYYDFLFLQFIEKFETDIEHIPSEYGTQLKELVYFAKNEKAQINNGDIIKCIKENYKSIFKAADDHYDSGLRDETLNYLICFNSGFRDCGVFEYLIKHYTYYALDNLERLLSIFKQNGNRLVRLLMIEQIHRILDVRFGMICEAIVGIHNRGIIDIAVESARIVYNKIIERNKSGEDAFSLQIDLNLAYKTLYHLKMEEAKQLLSLKREIDKRVNGWIENDGQVFEFEIPIGEYRRYLEEYDAPPFYKYLALTHDINNETKLWKSHIDSLSEDKQVSLMDLVATAQGTNSYFTLSKKMSFDIYITNYSLQLINWFSIPKFEDEFREFFKSNVDYIFEVLNHDISFEGLDENIKNFLDLVSGAISEREHGIALFNKTMFLISFLEKTLRLIYLSVDTKIFFEKNITLGSIFGSNNNLNPVMLRLLGEHQLRWTRYYLLKDDDEVGLEYRNRIAHLRDVKPNNFTTNEFLSIVWIVLSTLNTVFVNLINDEDLEEYIMNARKDEVDGEYSV
ncbi:hypothetical protein [Halanaerobium sp.]|uniref:hypothetical protein n=1 Tax=Halanaerobium sp. TaxID=1895664 RepID=UPI000DE7B386|nr:hypothetical protein [Halanaerobium sp.]PUU95028.1 MAG: hypothetical protein CI949_399 [Halanaerobium sp.]